ncbi:MAG: hypothetical protein ABEJ05_13220 [Haloglomus sp.]
MSDWMEKYAATDDLNEKYTILREELTRLRGQGRSEFFDREAVTETVRDINGEVDGVLIVFVANDFGMPVAYRPEDTGFEVQDAVRRAILENKYDDSHPDLDELRQTLLERHPAVHRAIVAEIERGSVRYHLPEGSNESTNFITVREMVGLVDYTTNSQQNEVLSEMY